MSQKRRQDEGSSSDNKRQKMLPFPRNVELEVMWLQSVQHSMEPVLEPLIRRIVKEEVDSAFKKYLTSMKWNYETETRPSESRNLQLQFLSTISLPVFTGTRIEGEECTSVKVALIDSVTEQIVSSGPESSAKIEIVVLEGDFDGDEGNSWTHEEFKNNIVREREGKKPLLTGDAHLYLKQGIGLVGEISFTDNSSWTRSRKFRLGARVMDNFDGVRVREAKTEPFIVRDHRGELYKKHHPPALHDEVWRLEKIGKDGAFHTRLSREKVYTVKDFLILLLLDPLRLRSILGTGMSAKMWEVTVDHARTCVLDKQLYMYSPPRSQHNSSVVFNVLGQLMGLLSEGQYIRVDELSEMEKSDGHKLVISAFGNWQEVVSVDDEAFLMHGSSRVSNTVYPLSSSTTESSDAGKILASEEIVRFDCQQLDDSSTDIMPSVCSLGGVDSLEEHGLHGIDSMDVNCDPTLSLSNRVANSLIFDMDSIHQTICDDQHLLYFNTDCSFENSPVDSEADLCAAVSSFLLPRAIGKAQRRRWTILFSVLRWFSIRRIVQRKQHVQKE